MKWLIGLIAALVQVLLPALIEATKRKSEDAQQQPELRERLRKRVRDTWIIPAVLAVLLVSGCTPGCTPRTIYVPDGEPVRLRADVRNAPVWVMGADGKTVAGVMTLPEGWYCLPVPLED